VASIKKPVWRKAAALAFERPWLVSILGIVFSCLFGLSYAHGICSAPHRFLSCLLTRCASVDWLDTLNDVWGCLRQRKNLLRGWFIRPEKSEQTKTLCFVLTLPQGGKRTTQKIAFANSQVNFGNILNKHAVRD